MFIWLLTHSEELKKKSGTGFLIRKVLPNHSKVIEWSRVQPNMEITDLNPETTAIVYFSTSETANLTQENICNIKDIIILDGTWQQAKKMYNQSPYLARFMHYEIHGEKSSYIKRKNQKADGLCTAEVAIHLLKKVANPKSAELEAAFNLFNQPR